MSADLEAEPEVTNKSFQRVRDCAGDDDDDATGLEEKIKNVFSHLESKIVLKLSTIIKIENSFEHAVALRVIDEEGMWVRELDKYQGSVLSTTSMKDYRPSTIPKCEKQTEPWRW